jgi:hypothetical protein
VRPVRVHKRRVRYRLAGCMAQTAEVEADGRIQRTIAVESEDRLTRLGENLEHAGAISAEPLERTPEGAAASSPSGTARRSTSSSACRSVRCATPSASGSPAWWTWQLVGRGAPSFPPC